jgi:D-inositol-3-phosphate glycosyltransferase
VLRRLAASPATLDRMSAGALRHAAGFGWSASVDQLLGVYAGAMDESRSDEARATVEA